MIHAVHIYKHLRCVCPKRSDGLVWKSLKVKAEDLGVSLTVFSFKLLTCRKQEIKKIRIRRFFINRFGANDLTT